MDRVKHAPKKVVTPSFVGKTYDCPLCGGSFSVTKRTAVHLVMDGATKRKFVHTICPHCTEHVNLDVDPHQNFRAKLSAFVLSQVAPIKAIGDDSIRIPMQKLLDDFNKLVQGE